MKNMICLLLALVLLEAEAWAGTKQDARVIVRNTSNLSAAVIIDPPSSLPPNPTLQQFQAAGGRILNPGASETFRIRAGSHVVVAQLVDNNGNLVGASTQQNVSLNRNQTVRLRVEGNTTAILVRE